MIDDKQAEKWLMEQWYGGRDGPISGPALFARAEGWDIFDCSGSSYGRWQISKIDEPDNGLALADDGEAWRIVLHGTEPHHALARCFIRQHEPMHWDEICAKAQICGVDVMRLSPELIAAIVAATFTYRDHAD